MERGERSISINSIPSFRGCLYRRALEAEWMFHVSWMEMKPDYENLKPEERDFLTQEQMDENYTLYPEMEALFDEFHHQLQMNHMKNCKDERCQTGYKNTMALLEKQSEAVDT